MTRKRGRAACTGVLSARYEFSVTACTECTIYKLPYQEFAEAFASNPSVVPQRLERWPRNPGIALPLVSTAVLLCVQVWTATENQQSRQTYFGKKDDER